MADKDRVFLAAPFIQFMDDDGRVIESWRQRLELLRGRLLAGDAAVFNAHHNEAWGDLGLPPEQCVPSDLRGMASCDVVCAYVGNPVSTGVALELGWASLLRKPIVLAADAEVGLSPMLRGLGSVTHIEPVRLKSGLDDAGIDEMVVTTSRLVEQQRAWGPSPWRGAGLDAALGYSTPDDAFVHAKPGEVTT